jgi:methanogenic corrinoid protein MtbC1
MVRQRVGKRLTNKGEDMDAKRFRGTSAKDNTASAKDGTSSGHYLQLALRALGELADNETVELDQGQLLEAFCHAFTMEDSTQRDRIISYLGKAGLTDEEILDRIIPSAARRIGEKWLQDELTFAQVTISAARMQELSRFLGGRGASVPSTIPLGFNMLLIIPVEEQHTMGAFVAADQFRREGVWVHLAIGQNAKELDRTVSNHHFSMIGISAASRRSLKSVKTIVDILKTRESSIPIVLGGNILNTVEDVQFKSKVDFITSKPQDALKLCGLPSPTPVLSGADDAI